MKTEPVRLDDPRLHAYRELRDKDLAREEGSFVAEGFEVVGHLARSEWRMESVLVAEPRWPRLAGILERAAIEVSKIPGRPAPEAFTGPVFVAPPAAMSKLVGFPIHRGVLALGKRESGPRPQFERPGTSLVLALMGLSNHDNVGGAFRNAAAFGAEAVLLDGATADPLYRKALRVSMGHALRVPWVRLGSERELLDCLEGYGYRTVGLSPGAERELDAVLSEAGTRVALIVGAEGPGLSEAVLGRIDSASIPMAPGVDSLNAATAAAVALYIAAKNRRP